MREIFYAILSRISFGKTASHLKSCILWHMRDADAQEYFVYFKRLQQCRCPKYSFFRHMFSYAEAPFGMVFLLL